VRLRLLPQPGEPALRAGMTASVSIDTKRERSLVRLIGGWTALATGEK
jgi:membrane fusion protein (multidrug efflux system)